MALREYIKENKQTATSTGIKAGDLVTYKNELTVARTSERLSFGIAVIYLIGVAYPVPVSEVTIHNNKK